MLYCFQKLVGKSSRVIGSFRALWCIVFSRFCENIKRITKTYPTNIKNNPANVKTIILKQQAKARNLV
jgi:hypothetical protein